MRERGRFLVLLAGLHYSLQLERGGWDAPKRSVGVSRMGPCARGEITLAKQVLPALQKEMLCLGGPHLPGLGIVATSAPPAGRSCCGGKVPVRLVFYPGEGHGNKRGASRYDYSLRRDHNGVVVSTS